MLDAAFLSAIGHPIRLEALVLFERQPSSTRELAEHVGLTPAAAGHHVRVLRDAGLLTTTDIRRRRGQDEAVYATRSRGWSRVAQQLGKLAEP